MLIFAPFITGAVANLNLTSQQLLDSHATAPDSGVRINADGTVDQREDAGSPVYTQIDSATDWIIPNIKANGLYEVKVEENDLTGGGTPTFRSPAGDADKGLSTWFTLDTAREWDVRAPGSSQVNSWFLQVSIRFNGGPTLATAEYELRVVDI